MRDLIIDMADFGGVVSAGDEVVLSAPAVRGSSVDPERIITPQPRTLELVDGVVTVPVEVGPLRVTLKPRGGVLPGTTFETVVPEGEGPITLRDCLEGQFLYDPPVVNRGLDLIEGARDEALGQVSDAVTAEVDAIKWARGAIPSDATLDSLADGIWWSSLQGVQMGLPSSMSGSLEISSASPSYRVATFTSISADKGVYTNRKSLSSGEWDGWVRGDAQSPGLNRYHGRVPVETASLDELAAGTWWVASTSYELGLPFNLSGSLIIVAYNTSYQTATFTSVGDDKGVWVNRRVASGWGDWTRVDARSPELNRYHGRVPVETASLDELAAGTWWVASTSYELGLPFGLSGSLIIVAYNTSYQTATFTSISADKGVWVNRRVASGWGDWTRIDNEAIELGPDPVEAFPDPNAPMEANMGRVVMWGDSLTQADYIRQRLTEMQPGSEFVNRGIASQDALEIAARQGGGMATIEVAGGEIPASGPVSVSYISQRVLLQTLLPVRTLTGTIRGVHGTLTNEADTHSYTFTRTQPGFPVPVLKGTYFAPDDALSFRHDAQIIWVGRNDAAGADPIRGVRSMLNWLTPARKRVVVLSLTGDSTWTQGKWQYEETVRINAELERMCGDSFIDLRRWLIDHGLDAVGITPTQADLNAIAGDAIPPSLSSDGTHFSSSTQTAIGTWLHGELLARGWWPTSA